MNPIKWMKRIESSYRITLGSPAGVEALTDLRTFCYASKSPIGSTVEETYRRLGRQEVFQRITNALNLTIEEIYQLEEIYDDD